MSTDRDPRMLDGVDNTFDFSVGTWQAKLNGIASPDQVATRTRFASGQRIGHYELIRELGRGGMGAVYLARDLMLGRRVAIKSLTTDESSAQERFLVEARATAQCTHENIVVIHEVGQHQGAPYMVLEYLSGQPLAAHLGTLPVPADRAVEIMVPLVRALACAHQRGIVHRDLKPDNIFVTDTGTIKVLDFGIAKLLGGEHSLAEKVAANLTVMTSARKLRLSQLTEAGSLVGTLPFMSPEQWGAGPVDHRTDIWAAGILLFSLVTGRHPLEPLRLERLASIALIEEPMPPVRTIAPDVPVELATIIDHCLVKPAEERMPSAEALLRALEPLMPGVRRSALDADESPYPGLAAFQETDADRFFGRSWDIATVSVGLREKPLVCVVGPSGAGKSSLVRAGVIPALRSSGQPWETIVLRPGRYPLMSLAGRLAPLMLVDDATAEQDLSASEAIAQRLGSEPGYLGAFLRSRARTYKTSILLFVDQVEELYTLAEPGERACFLRCLLGAADDPGAPLRVILTMRSDFLERLAEERELMAEIGRGLCILPPPNRAGLEEALVKPAKRAGVRFESREMIDDMLAALVSTPGALPLLQFTAGLLWDARDRNARMLTRDSYERLGGVAGALAGHADAVLGALPAHLQVIARAVFRRLVTAERTRDIVALGELSTLARAGDVEQAVRYFVDARLLVVHHGEAGGSVELVHESLIDSWPTLRRWLDENREIAAFLAQLRPAARQWRARDRSAGLLWRGDAADEAQRMLPLCQDGLTGADREYIDAVIALARRAACVRRRLIIGTMAFLMALVVASAVALLWIRNAEQNARDEAERARSAERVAQEQAARIQENEQHIRKQLAELEAERQATQRAQQEAASAGALEAMTRQELVDALEQMQVARDRESKARGIAEHEAERARRETVRAEEARGQAEQAMQALERTVADKQRLVQERERRIRELEKSSGKIITGPLDR